MGSSGIANVDLVALAIAITGVLAIGLPLARAWAGQRSGEQRGRWRRATLLTALGMVGWLALTGALALTGVLGHFDQMPPSIMPLFVASLVLTIVLARSSWGRTLAEGLPLWLLVGFQAYRIPVEIMLHRAYEHEVIGAQMTWSGLNFDVITGVSAALLGAWLWRRGDQQPVPRGIVWGWNLIGLGLLITIVSISVMSMPTPMRVFTEGPANTFVAELPFVWLPTVMVMTALLGHLLVGRRLLVEARRS